MKFPLSVLDLSPVSTGSSRAQALRNILDLARHADGLGLPDSHHSGEGDLLASGDLDHLHEWESLATAG